MRKIFVTVMVLMGVLGTMNMNAMNDVMNDAPFKADASRLGKYLELAIEQQQVVDRLNNSFIEAQTASTNAEELDAAVKENLKQMRKTLDLKQMRKYIALLNVTANNKKVEFGEDSSNFFSQR